ncbi:DNA-directed RNA polymerase I subunit RPA34 isoform X1 [Agelaius tricolor]|uniref:DNA-directed RNA polymerase I subunit RPA34 isoform X1 n=1 Tax=Agelaius tricolor TaxID=9191 RepID=UPI0039F1FFBF
MEGPPPRFRCPPEFEAAPGGVPMGGPQTELWLIQAPADFCPQSLEGCPVPLNGLERLRPCLGATTGDNDNNGDTNSGDALYVLRGGPAGQGWHCPLLLSPMSPGGSLGCAPPMRGSLSIARSFGTATVAPGDTATAPPSATAMVAPGDTGTAPPSATAPPSGTATVAPGDTGTAPPEGPGPPEVTKRRKKRKKEKREGQE